MTTKKNNIKRRWLLSLVSILTVVFILWCIGKILVYFHVGATEIQVHTVTTDYKKRHTPMVNISPDSAGIGTYAEDFLLMDIIEGYTDAWLGLNIFLENHRIEYLEDAFTDALKNRLIEQNPPPPFGLWRMKQRDLEHNLSLTQLSLDKKFAALSDSNVSVIRHMYEADGDLEFDTLLRYNIDVIMLREEGMWRVDKWQFDPINDTTNIRPAGDKKFVRAKGGKLVYGDSELRVRGINYYPAESPWVDFWETFDEDVISEDIELIGSLGFNTVRIFIPYSIFGGADIDLEKIELLNKLLRLIESEKLWAVPTLFDFPEGFSIEYYTNTDRHLETLLTNFRDDPVILAWDLKNEPDLDFKNHGEDIVIEWLEFMELRARAYDPNHLLTVGWSTAEAAGYLSDKVDVVSFHHYKSVRDLEQRIPGLRKSSNGKPLFLQEFGMSTNRSLLMPLGNTGNQQKTYLAKILECADREGLNYALWTLKDFEKAPTEVFGWKPWIRSKQKSFGILHSDGKEKNAAVLFKRIGSLE